MPLKVFTGPFQPVLEDAFIASLASEPPGSDRHRPRPPSSVMDGAVPSSNQGWGRSSHGAARSIAEDAGRRLAVVTPSRRLADRLQRLVCLERGLSLLNVRFHTFFSLACEIVEEGAVPEKTVIGDGLFHDMIVDGVLRSRSARPSRGLAAAYRASLRDLHDAGVEPEAFREHFADLLPAPQKERLEDLFILQEAYQETLERLGVVTPSGLARLAAAAVEDGRSNALERYSRILYYGFYDLTGVQADFFTAVTGAYPCEVFFPYLKGHPAYAFAKRFFDLKLSGRPRPRPPSSVMDGAVPSSNRGWGRSSHGAARSIAEDAGRGGESAPAGAWDSLFVPGKQERLEGSRLPKIISVSGSRDEAWAAAKEALELHEKLGLAFGEIGIVARTLEPYRQALPQALRASGVPFFTTAGEPLLRHPAAKLALSLLSLRRLDFPSQAVLDIIASPYFIASRRAANWRRLIARLGIHSGWLQWAGKVPACAKKDLELFPQAVSEGRKGFAIPKEDSAELWTFMEGLRARLDPARRAPWGDHCAGAKALLESVLAGDGPAWEKTLAVLAELKVFALVFPEASWGEFLEVLEEKFRRTTLDAGAENRGVRLLDAMDARGDSFRALILVGLSDGLFPRHVREDPLLSDSVRARLRHPAGYWIGPKLEGYDEEKLLFHLLVSSARERLVCVYQRSDDEGRSKIPSTYLRELSRACGADWESAPQRRVARQPLEKLRGLPAELLSEKEANLLLAQGKPFGGDFDDCLGRVESLRAPGEPGELDGIIGPRAKLPETLSPTALDSFSACPFQFFASRVLGLRDVEEASERGELSPKIRGTIYHSILEGFYGDLHAAAFWRKPESSWEPILDKRVGEAFREFGWEELGLYPLLWESARRRMSSQLKRFVERDIRDIRDTGLIPVEFEKELKGVIGGKALRGWADRIDSDGKGRFRVVDYKSTWSRSRGALEKKVLAMEAHQPPLYLEMAGREGEEAAGAFYHIIEEAPELTGNPSVQGFPAAAWRAARQAILRNVASSIAQMERGEFLIAPDDERGGACGYCDFSWLCRKAHPATRRRAEDSKLRAAFDAAHKTS